VYLGDWGVLHGRITQVSTFAGCCPLAHGTEFSATFGINDFAISTVAEDLENRRRMRPEARWEWDKNIETHSHVVHAC